MNTRFYLIITLFLSFIMSHPCHAQLTINIRYSGDNGNARKYVEEMESSGIAAKIRAIEGCLRYDYFYPADDPEGLLLIDEWTGQEALNRYHSSPVMQEAATLREKYKLGGRQVRMYNPTGAITWEKGQPNDAYAQYFTGQSYLNPLSGGYANVTFGPGCRNNWHIHHGAVQVLICVGGRGWYQEWGKPAVALSPGTIIEIPEGVKHWHGAAKDRWMQHLAIHTKEQEGASNEWLEPVDDETYSKLQ